jgi:S-adenosylmethionine-dependent methyltransferase
MTESLANVDLERFRTGAAKYAAYLETFEGRLRLDLSFTNLQEFLPPAARSVLDLGGGTGAMAVRLARLGLHVTLVDSSSPMLELAERAAQESRVTENVVCKHGDAARLLKLVDARSFDVVICHNILEYVDDPSAVLHEAALALRDSNSIMSVLVRNQSGEVLKSAILEGDLAAAEHNLAAEWAHESLYGGKVRLFTLQSVQIMLTDAAMEVAAERGVRVLSDYLPSKISKEQEYERILDLERKLGKRPEFARVARYLQCVARRVDARLKGRE